MKLVISLVTRGRPAQLVETVKKTTPLWANENTCLVVQVDEDDEATVEHLSNPKTQLWADPRVHINIKPREDTLAEKINRAMSVPGDVYLVASDDDPVVTAGYDDIILNAASLFDDGIGFVHGHMANLSFASFVAPTAKMVEKLGYIQPGGLFPYWFVDHWTHDLAHMMQRVSLADVRTDQSKAGRTQELREPAFWATFYDACYMIRRKEAHEIILSGDFEATESTKQRLLLNYHEVEMRSRWINDNVRAMEAQLVSVGGPRTDDARYQRVRKHAMDMLPTLLREMPTEVAVKFSLALNPPKLIPALNRAWA